MDSRIENLIKNWQKRNIQGFYAQGKNEAADKILKIIPVLASIGFSGSLTLEQLDIVKRLDERGNKVFNPYKPGIARQESLELRKQGAQADYYLASPNGISEKGELVFFSAYGNRTTGIAYAKNVLIVSGINKITENVEKAIKRSREYATPLNCKRINWNTPCFKGGVCRQDICLFPEYKRMCCQVLIIEAEAIADRMKVVLIGESLGY